MLWVLLPAVSALIAPQPWVRTAAPSKTSIPAEPFTAGTEEFKSTFPEISSYGWGVSTKAERWNGRHAMFGWVFIIATGYAKAHGLIPEPDKLLDLKAWGTLAEITPRVSTITNERAIILIANVHALVMSICCTFAPLPFQDKLLLNPDEQEIDEEPYGIIPPLDTGLTPAAELMNGRMAMLGIVTVSAYSLIYQIPFLDVVNTMLGGLLLKA